MNGIIVILFSLLAVSAGAAPMKGLWRSSQNVIWQQADFPIEGRTFFLQTPHKSWPLSFDERRGNDLHFRANIDHASIDELIRAELKLVALDGNGQTRQQTFLRLGPLLDELYFYEGDDLGSRFTARKTGLKLWAPTAKQVRLHLYRQASQNRRSPSETLEMQREPNGVWSVDLAKKYSGWFYLFEVTVFSPLSGRMQTELVTDPYSYALTGDSEKTFLTDPFNSDFMPAGWSSHARPVSPDRAVSVYEMHVRDYTIFDSTVPERMRGKFLALTQKQSRSVKHLRKMAANGLTHVQLMPVLDFASVPEGNPKNPLIPPNLPPASLKPQELIGLTRAEDSYNWGYDPFHFFAPDGSYAVNPTERILEMRAMVQGLHEIGLKVILDVAYNHTFAHLTQPFSVFDRIVPAYFYRYRPDGEVNNSSCCADTASERKMFEKLMRQSVRYLVKAYGVDGFRFDLANLHSVETMKRIKADLEKLEDEIGLPLILNAEAWPFSSLPAEEGPSFQQTHTYGLGISTFNDRLRDALRGGTTGPEKKSDQGYLTGLYYDFNSEPANRDTPPDKPAQLARLLHYGDVVRIGLAGNLRDFILREHQGHHVRAGELFFRGTPTAYARSPQETINYVSAHDGYTLWDAIAAKVPFSTRDRQPATMSAENRMRLQKLALAFVAFSQGKAFFHSGGERLRSKSGDSDSYDSGDHFNGLRWDHLLFNGWGIGMPVAWKNEEDWSFWGPRLKSRETYTTAEHVSSTENYFFSLLKLRRDLGVFEYSTTDQVQSHLKFLNAEKGPARIPGLILMELKPLRSSPVTMIAFNVANEQAVFQTDRLYQVHPQWRSIEPSVKVVSVQPAASFVSMPPRTAAVFVAVD